MLVLVYSMTADSSTSCTDKRRPNVSMTSSLSSEEGRCEGGLKCRRLGLCNIFSGVGSDEVVDLQHVGRRLKRHRISSLTSGKRRSSDSFFLPSSASFDTNIEGGRCLNLSRPLHTTFDLSISYIYVFRHRIFWNNFKATIA